MAAGVLSHSYLRYNLLQIVIYRKKPYCAEGTTILRITSLIFSSKASENGKTHKKKINFPLPATL
jgi:hypothetical protein